MKNALAAAAKSALVALWFALLTFPFIGMRPSPDDGEVLYFPARTAAVAALFFALALILRAKKKGAAARALFAPIINPAARALEKMRAKETQAAALAALLLMMCVFPFLFSAYQVSIMTTALLFVMLGLGLNIVVGLAGLLDLGYVAFFAVGAYTYALAHEYWGMGFWAALPAAGALAALSGIVLGVPVLRLRGDYLAIVTLGFGEIIRLVLENWGEVTKGPAGVAGIAPPGAPVEISFEASQIYMYFVVLIMTALTIVIVRRLANSRLGRAWVALREDEIACQAAGADKTRTKLSAFALGALWAGFVGVCFAAKNTYVNPASFTFLQSAIILCIVVLGGMGGTLGVIIAALVITLLPEYLRGLADYRMLAFGAAMVLMMVLRPAGLLSPQRPVYPPDDAEDGGGENENKKPRAQNNIAQGAEA